MHEDLDHSIWNALTTAHADLAIAAGRARRYPPDVSPLAAVERPDPAAFADLESLVSPGEQVALFTLGPYEAAPGWRIAKGRFIDQMVCVDEADTPDMPSTASVRPLTGQDVPDMLELTALTKPGPFLPNTIRMGRYVGIRASDGRLVAMAGERLKLARYTEVSAVCSHPDHRGRGYVQAVMGRMLALVRAEGKTPFLHVKTENTPAKIVYERLGFRVRQPTWWTMLERA
jgi:ribosomal protein S18 acetylase RimI-like enzyme